MATGEWYERGDPGLENFVVGALCDIPRRRVPLEQVLHGVGTDLEGGYILVILAGESEHVGPAILVLGGLHWWGVGGEYNEVHTVHDWCF